ncbi:MAG: methyltransferase domain-containing protein [Candidatus Hodarchaeales archaeon]|jgi:ubiquinone/menaquinone biosynthesis C-methylase UbiE
MLSYLLPAIRAYFSRKRVAIEDIPSGRILDIGGGGEGIIAQIGGDKVTAIDKLESEIEEARPKAPTATWKVEDARDMSFEDGSFDHATAFFSLMYMRKPRVKEEVLAEVFRVLSPGGEFWIWDANISGTKETFIIFLKIELPSGKIVKTGYGAKGKGKQTVDEISNMLQEIGFEVNVVSSDKAWFFLKARKPI